jgi:hypothetical protein
MLTQNSEQKTRCTQPTHEPYHSPLTPALSLRKVLSMQTVNMRKWNDAANKSNFLHFLYPFSGCEPTAYATPSRES